MVKGLKRSTPKSETLVLELNGGGLLIEEEESDPGDVDDVDEAKLGVCMNPGVRLLPDAGLVAAVLVASPGARLDGLLSRRASLRLFVLLR